MKLIPWRNRNAPVAASTEVVATPVVSKSLARRARVSVHSLARALFSGADTNRLTGDWSTVPQPAEWIVAKHQRALVARSREQACNNDYMRAYIRLCRLNIVGEKGIVFQSKALTKGGKLDQKAQKAVEKFLKEWSKPKNCDIAGKLSFVAMQRHLTESAARDGEFFVRFVVGPDAGNKFGFALQVIDPQRCPVEYDVFDLPNGSFIRSGIEYNRYGRPLAYWFHNEDPQSARFGYTYGGKPTIRVPANEVLHGFVAEFVGQKRGLPWLATGLFRLKQMGAFEDAAITNARIGAAKMGFIEYEAGMGPEDGEDDNSEIDTEPGAFVRLPEGARVNKFDPTYPSGEFAPFMKQMLRSLATGGGVSYHTLAQDLEGVNFSSIRQGTLDEREFYIERQEWLTEEFCAPVVEALLFRGLLGGHVKSETGRVYTLADEEAVAPHSWQPRRWQWIDPRADVQAAIEARNGMMKSTGSIIRESGEDPMTVYQEWAQDIADMKAAGIPDEFIKAALEIPPPKPAPGDATPKETAPKSEDK